MVLDCPKCGALLNGSDHFCPHCGGELGYGSPEQFVETPSGNSPPRYVPARREGYDWLTTLLLAVFLGQFGVQRFYTGNIALGLIILLTFGGCGIAWIVDVILIATDNYRDGDGRALVKN